MDASCLTWFCFLWMFNLIERCFSNMLKILLSKPENGEGLNNDKG